MSNFLSIAKAMAYHLAYGEDIITNGAYHQLQAVSFAMMIYNGKPLMIYDAPHQ